MNQYDSPSANNTATVFSVSELNREARYLLEDTFPAVMVEGEISNIATPGSGHWYLTLKDDRAQIRCAMFRNRNMMVRFKPKNGMQVLLKAKLSLYEGRGDYQLIVESMEELGDGALRRAFDELKEKLLKEGLFNEEAKQAVPALPAHIAVITSPTGAAIRDVLSVLKRRFPLIPVTVVPVAVQGDNSATEIIQAIEKVNQRQGCLEDVDVILLTRGGGSLEDLWSFNNEALARTINKSRLPVISAVGHEVDFTIADFVADMRAATPSAAAELLSPDQNEYRQVIANLHQHLRNSVLSSISVSSAKLLSLKKQLRHPGHRLQEHAQRLDNLETRGTRAMQAALLQRRNKLQLASTKIRFYSPARMVSQTRNKLANEQQRLCRAISNLLAHKANGLAKTSHSLNTVSPLGTLARGYSITTDTDQKVLTDASQLDIGDTVKTRLAQGEFVSQVLKTSKGSIQTN